MRRKFAPGYTLLEVLVVVAIVAVLFGVGIAAYSRFDRVRKVEQAALTFGMDLRKTQKKADAGEKPIGSCTSGEVLDGYYIFANVGNNYADESYVCSGATSFHQQLDLINGANFATSILEVTFQTIGRGVKVASGHDQTIISDANSSAQYKVSVDPGGAITVERVP
jgi:prepilin-type N-terminal cleavage/methylation domain-containing protein